MPPEVGQQLFPGEVLTGLQSAKGEKTFIGPGLKVNDEEPNSVIVTKAGVLAFKSPNTYWIEAIQKRYIPRKNDLVVGIVAKRAGDSFKGLSIIYINIIQQKCTEIFFIVDIGSSELASLSMMAFEGATKKQKPDLQIGDSVYARLLSAHKEMEPELVCVDSFYKVGYITKT